MRLERVKGDGENSDRRRPRSGRDAADRSERRHKSMAMKKKLTTVLDLVPIGESTNPKHSAEELTIPKCKVNL